MNAAGARSDGLISDPEHPSFDWDGIWNARTARTADGWSAEIVIPARTLGFTAGPKSWGVNFERFVTPKFRAGTLLTHGDPEGRRRNLLAGLDAVWPTSQFRGDKNLLIGARAAFTLGDGNPALSEGSRGEWGFKVDYPNDLVDCSTTLTEVGEALDHSLVFLPRPGVRHLISDRLQPRPARDGRLSQLSGQLRWTSPQGRAQVGLAAEHNAGRLRSSIRSLTTSA